MLAASPAFDDGRRWFVGGILGQRPPGMMALGLHVRGVRRWQVFSLALDSGKEGSVMVSAPVACAAADAASLTGLGLWHSEMASATPSGAVRFAIRVLVTLGALPGRECKEVRELIAGLLKAEPGQVNPSKNGKPVDRQEGQVKSSAGLDCTSNPALRASGILRMPIFLFAEVVKRMPIVETLGSWDDTPSPLSTESQMNRENLSTTQARTIRGGEG